MAVALGYGSGSAVSHAIRRIDNGPAELRRTVERIFEALQRCLFTIHGLTPVDPSLHSRSSGGQPGKKHEYTH